ncbi:MAG: glycosyltransferase family 39 protein [Nitrososphaerales archaeon]
MIIRIMRVGETRLWIPPGLVVGVGLLTKLSRFIFVVALFLSFLIIPSGRRYLRSKWISLGALISFGLVLPMIYWNSVNSWPMVDFYLHVRGYAGGGGPISFFASQILSINPLNIPILLAPLISF